jgi:hypothetical protein
VYVCVCVTGDTRDVELLLFNDDDFRKRIIVLNSNGDGTVPIYNIEVDRYTWKKGHTIDSPHTYQMTMTHHLSLGLLLRH